MSLVSSRYSVARLSRQSADPDAIVIEEDLSSTETLTRTRISKHPTEERAHERTYHTSIIPLQKRTTERTNYWSQRPT